MFHFGKNSNPVIEGLLHSSINHTYQILNNLSEPLYIVASAVTRGVRWLVYLKVQRKNGNISFTRVIK